MRVLLVAVAALGLLVACAAALPSLADAGIDASNVDSLLTPVGLVGGEQAVQAAAAAPTLLEMEASTEVAVKAPVHVSEAALNQMMESVMADVDSATASNVEELFSMDDTNPALDETVFLEEATEVSTPDAENPAADGQSYEAGNWGGPQIGPGGALGSYWLGGGFAATNAPQAYVPGTPILHPFSNINPFYYPRYHYRFNPYVPYTLGVNSPSYGPYYNGQAYMDTGLYAPGPADAGTHVFETQTGPNAFLEADAETEEQEQEQEQEEGDMEPMIVNPGQFPVHLNKVEPAPSLQDLPLPTHTQPSVGNPAGIVAGPEDEVADLQEPEKEFYDQYSVEAGYNADLPKRVNDYKAALRKAAEGSFFRRPEYTAFAAPWDQTAPIKGKKALKAVYDPEAVLPQAPADTLRFEVVTVPKATGAAEPLTAPADSAPAHSMLQFAARQQAVEAQAQHDALSKGKLHGLARKIALSGQFEPTYK